MEERVIKAVVEEIVFELKDPDKPKEILMSINVDEKLELTNIKIDDGSLLYDPNQGLILHLTKGPLVEASNKIDLEVGESLELCIEIKTDESNQKSWKIKSIIFKRLI